MKLFGYTGKYRIVERNGDEYRGEAEYKLFSVSLWEDPFAFYEESVEKSEWKIVAYLNVKLGKNKIVKTGQI